MNLEIERKWLVSIDRIPYDLTQMNKAALEQAYISFDPTIRIRRVNGGEKQFLTVKARLSENDPLSRREEEFEISAASYDFLLQKHEGTVVTKDRYKIKNTDGLIEEIDIFGGALTGLAYLEIEFPNADAAKKYPSPAWIDKEVTDDPAYTNAALAKYGRPPLTAASNPL